MYKSVAIHQPNYIPWLGYFYKISQVECFVFLDDVQFSNEGMHNYHYIKTQNGPLRLKIPVFQSLGDRINEIRVKDELNWREKHLSLLKANYKHADYFEEVFTDYMSLINENQGLLADLNESIIKFLCKKLSIKTEFINSSSLKITSSKEDKIIDICTALGCNIYYSGTGARIYQNEEHFEIKGIQLKYSEYRSFEYKQQFHGFQSNVTILDFLMNCGYHWDIVNEMQDVK